MNIHRYYVYITIYTYLTHIHSTLNDLAPLPKNTVKYSVFEHDTQLCLPPGKGST